MAHCMPVSVAIAGGGIGGLCLAIGLLQYPHLNVSIYEAAPEFREIGAGLALGPNAQRALACISPTAAEAFRRHATSNTSADFEKTWFEFRNGLQGADEVLGKCENATGQQTVHRAKFLAELVKLIPQGMAHFGKELVDINESGDQVLIHFADGTNASTDCLIGADGVHSATREHVVGEAQPAATPVFSGIVAYRGLIPMIQAQAKLGEFADDAYMWCGDGGMVMTYPIDFGKTLNVVAAHSGVKDWQAPSAVVPSSNEKLMEDFEGWSEVPTKVLELVENPTLWAMMDHLPAPCYNVGNIAMMGDAAHATTPFQGAGCGQAIEDALVLATLFRYVRYPEHIAPALAAYDAVRRPRSQKIVETSREAMELYGFTDGNDRSYRDRLITSSALPSYLRRRPRRIANYTALSKAFAPALRRRRRLAAMDTTYLPTYTPDQVQEDTRPEYTPSRPPSYRTVASMAQPTLQNSTRSQNAVAASRANEPTIYASRGPQAVAAQYNIYSEGGFTGRKSVTFTLPDKRTPAYFVDYRSGLADLLIRRVNSSGPVIGSVKYHHFTSRIDLAFGGKHKAEMSKDGVFTRRFLVELPAGPERQFYWKGTSDYGTSSLSGGGLKLEGAATGKVFAAFARSLRFSKDGQLNILIEGLDEQFLDQIVVSFIAMMEAERRRGGAGAAGGGGGA
ncbi:FAD/NAD(P)-binding domain-containing protein [Lophium mytilinum]|uniref:FAD/NAD(P)-binding domain-containing protein n=1 Tax=Lophium mytilinum TaxID=390894 RepID=A0A6A6RBF8_9PEZI|nr:FAD/NAD(P)-binding domain-containing protein [Lophium mytilinum]